MTVKEKNVGSVRVLLTFEGGLDAAASSNTEFSQMIDLSFVLRSFGGRVFLAVETPDVGGGAVDPEVFLPRQSYWLTGGEARNFQALVAPEAPENFKKFLADPGSKASSAEPLPGPLGSSGDDDASKLVS